MDEMDLVRKTIEANIDYEGLLWDHPADQDIFDGYVSLMSEACCSARESLRICGEDIPTAMVRRRFLEVNQEHILYVRDCLCFTSTPISNIKAYTLAALYNAPVTMDQYYAALVGRDLTRA